jgi:bisphosphoglycerate-independent phosphoglycerate mutase (AlkP superfamily)
MDVILNVMKEDHPDSIFINFKEPDVSGHTGIWADYINAIHLTDYYIGQLFDYINSSHYYKDITDIIIVNDHGRHSDGINGGFKEHGCSCEGCRHIMCIAYGPDFKKGFEYNAACDQTDIPVTAAYLLGVSLPASTGKIINEILVEN